MSRNHLFARASVGALAFALAFSMAQAQEALPPIDVGAQQRQPAAAPVSSNAILTGAPIPADKAGSLTVPSVAEQKNETYKNAGSVAFVDMDTPELQTRHIDDLSDALKDVPGVYAESRYGQEMRLSLRGSNLTRDYHLRGIELLQDGTPMNYADGGGDFYQVDPRYYRAIEIYKGGNALSFGSGTLGGAVNFISPTAYTALAPNLLAIEGGSYGAIRGQVQVSRVIGDFDFLVNGTFTSSDGYRAHEDTNYTHIDGNVGYRFSKNLETRFYFGVYETWQQLPGELSLSDARSFPYLSTTPFVPGIGPYGFGANQARDVKNYRLSNKTTLETDFGRIDLNSWFVYNDLYHPVFVVIEQQGTNWGFNPKLTSNFNVAGHPNELIVGGRIWGGTSTDNWFANYNGMPLNPYGLIPANFANAMYSFPPYSFNGLAQFGAANSCFGFCGLFLNPGASAQIRNNRATAFNLESYFEDRFKIAPGLTLMFGAKLFSDTRRYDVIGGIPFEPIPGTSEIVYRGLLPKVGVLVEPQKDIQFFADMTGSRDVPDFIDLTQGAFPPTTTSGSTFTPLKAQKAWTGEIGSRGKWDRFSWDVTFYHSELQDELLKFNVNPGLGVPATTFNAKRTMHQGLEISGSVELMRDLTGPGAGDALKLTQLWNWNDFRFVNDANFSSNPLAGIPRHVLRTTLSYARRDGLYIAPSIDWVPQGVYVDYAHSLEAPGYALYGVQAGYKLPHGVSIYLDARNLSNRHYITDVSTIIDARGQNPQSFYPGNGRSIAGGVRYAF